MKTNPKPKLLRKLAGPGEIITITKIKQRTDTEVHERIIDFTIIDYLFVSTYRILMVGDLSFRDSSVTQISHIILLR